MNRYRALKRRTAFGFCLFLLVTLLLGASKAHEIYPIYSFALFATFESSREDYVVLVTELNGRRLSPARELRTALDLPPLAKDPTLYPVTNELGQALVRKDASSVGRLRRLLEAKFHRPGHDVVYRVERRSYEVLKFWREGSFDTTSLGEFRAHFD